VQVSETAISGTFNFPHVFSSAGSTGRLARGKLVMGRPLQATNILLSPQCMQLALIKRAVQRIAV